jgi:hypothetical protein
MRTKIEAVLVGIAVAAFCFVGPICYLVWSLHGDDTLVWMWLFGGPILLGFLLVVSSVVGFIVGTIYYACAVRKNVPAAENSN